MKHVFFSLLISLPIITRAFSIAYPVPVQQRLPVGSGRYQQIVKVSNREGASYGSYDLPNPECGPFGGGDVWLVADAPVSGSLVVGGNYSDFSLTRMAFYAFRDGELVPLACAFPEQLHQVPQTKLSGLEPGEPIFVRVWDAGNDEIGIAEIGAYDPDGHLWPGRTSSLATSIAKQSQVTELVRPAFPNPAGEELSVPLAGSEQNANLTLVDMSGRLVLEYQAREQEIAHFNLQDLANGLYVLRVQSQAGIRKELLQVRH